MVIKLKLIYILLIACTYMLMIMGTRPTITLFAHELGASITHIGLITSLFSLFPLLFAIILGKKIDKINVKISLLIGGYLGILGIALPSILPNLTGLYLSQLIAGLAQTIFILSAQDYVGRISNKQNRNKYVGWFSLGIATGTLIGPVLGGFTADALSYEKTFLILSIVGLVSCIMIHIIPNEYPIRNKNISQKGRTSLLELLQIPNMRTALVFSVLILFAKDIYLTFFPLLGLHFGYSNSQIGILLAINGAASVFIRFFLSPLTDQFGSTRVFIGSMIICSISFIFLPLFPRLILAGIIAFILGVGLGIGQPLSITLTIDSALNGRVAESLGLRLTVNRLTQMASPIAFGALANIFGIIIIFFVSSSIIFTGSLLVNKGTQKMVNDGDKKISV